MKTLARITFLLLSLAVVVFSVCFLIAIYHSTQSITATEIKPIEESLQKVSEVLKQQSAPNGLIAKLDSDTAKLQSSLKTITGSTNSTPEMHRQAMDDLTRVVLDLNTLQTDWSKENTDNQSTLTEVLSKLGTFRNRLEPTTGFDKVAATVMTHVALLLAGLAKTVVLLAWPLAAFLIVWLLFKSPGVPARIKDLVSNFKTLEVAGFKLERADEVRESVEESFAVYRKQVNDLYDRVANKKDLEQRVAKLFGTDSKILAEINKARKAAEPDAPGLTDFRCTIHVPDLLFAETFYQLLNYFPSQPNQITKGRTWSYRFGFIGRTWRTEKSAIARVAASVDDLIDEWGMTRAEASGAQDRKSFLGVLIRDDDDEAVGLFYMDSKEENAFGAVSNQALCDSILAILVETKIRKDLISIEKELSSRAPKIRIYSQR